jgi:hypothetical protein
VAEGIASVTGERAVAVGAGPVLVRWTAPDALSNLVSVLELAADGQVRYSASTRRPTAATVKLVEDVLVTGDFYDSGEPIAAFAWPLLIQVGGLAVLARGDDPANPARGHPATRLELSARGRAALARPSYEALGALWARWLGSVSTDELARIEAIKGQRKPGTLTSAISRRAAVAAALAALQPGAWTGAGKLLASLRSQQQPPLVAARSLRALWRLYVVDSYYGSLGHAGSRTWDLVEGRYALCVLFEYAATLGLVDVAYTDPRGARDDYRALWGADQLSCLSRYDGLSAIRVNELGAAVLHDPDALPSLGLPVPRGVIPRPTGNRS